MGRRPKPAALREAQGNPGRRPIPKDSSAMETGRAVSEKSKNPLTFAKVSRDARMVFDLVAPQLRRMNFLRESDEPAFWRYCDTMARYWRVTQRLNEMGGETYDCPTTNGGVMARMRPEFMVQERLAKRLDGLEDRFGLTPAARQSYILALQRAPQLPFDPPHSGGHKQNQQPSPSPPDMQRPAVIGGARGQLN